jgi:hypothetical protein
MLHEYTRALEFANTPDYMGLRAMLRELLQQRRWQQERNGGVQQRGLRRWRCWQSAPADIANAARKAHPVTPPMPLAKRPTFYCCGLPISMLSTITAFCM